MAVESCDVYIIGVKQEGVSWTKDSDALLDEISNNIADIERFNFVSISLVESEVYNFFLKTTNYESMTIYLKGVKYFGKSYLLDSEIIKLKTQIRLYLSYVYGLSFEKIDIRCSNKYDYTELENLCLSQ